MIKIQSMRISIKGPLVCFHVVVASGDCVFVSVGVPRPCVNEFGHVNSLEACRLSAPLLIFGCRSQLEVRGLLRGGHRVFISL